MRPKQPALPRRIDLVTITPVNMNAPKGDIIIGGIGVQAWSADDGSPASGVKLLASVVVGSGSLGQRRKKRLSVVTGADGRVRLDVNLSNAGYTLYEVAVKNSSARSVFFVSRTNEMTARISLYTQPCQPASAGRIEVDISALDYDGNAVSGASLVLEAHNDQIFEESSIDGQVTEVAPGRYRGIIQNNRAGGITLISQDLRSKNIGSTVVHVLPGPPHHIAVIGSTDPRAKPPYDSVDLQAQLRDELDNPLPPTRIQAHTGDGKAIPARLDGYDAFFRVQAVGYQHVPIVLSDSQSNTRESVTVVLAATWLSNPGIVLTGADFATELRVTPRPGTSTDHGTVTIKFDPARAAFKGFRSSGLFDARYETRVEGDELILDFQSETSYAADDYPEGMYLGDVTWDCLGEGETCFLCSGRMSPTTEAWELCLQQKKDRKDCICIRVISIAGDAASLAAGNGVADQVASVLSSDTNVGNCCPVLTVNRDNSTITQAQLNALVGADGTVSTRAEQRALHADGTGVKKNCINIKSVPVSIPVVGGTVRGNTDRGAGSILMDPTEAAADPNSGVHEVGHTLDLDHRDAAGALMKPSTPVGTGLNQDECKKVFQNISRYPC